VDEATLVRRRQGDFAKRSFAKAAFDPGLRAISARRLDRAGMSPGTSAARPALRPREAGISLDRNMDVRKRRGWRRAIQANALMLFVRRPQQQQKYASRHPRAKHAGCRIQRAAGRVPTSPPEARGPSAMAITVGSNGQKIGPRLVGKIHVSGRRTTTRKPGRRMPGQHVHRCRWTPGHHIRPATHE